MSFEFNGTPVDFETFVDTNRLRNADAYEMMLSLQVGQAMNFGNGNLLERVK